MTDPHASNEILEAVKATKTQAASAADKAAQKARSWPLAKIGFGVGIGSAAVAAAVLFANRSKS